MERNAVEALNFQPGAAMKTLLWIVCLAFLALPVQAQCVNTSAPTCGVYESCFAKACACQSSPHEYFVSYGKRYCETFLNLATLSAKGKAWRDSTLRCLQEQIVPALPADGSAALCDCAKMQAFAFDKHVACYTQPGASICSLPASDWKAILDAVDPVKTLSDAKGRKQMLDVAAICLPAVAADAKDSVQKLIDKLRR
jgi:hypothetical protein